MNRNREEYLKTIFKLSEREEKVTNKLIAEKMKIAPPSVSEMLKKLQKEGLVNIRNNIITLTEKGLSVTKNILDCHRLWEIFLYDYLDFDWQDVHSKADLLEHVTDENLKNHLNKFLNYPKTCPHGSIIFENWKDNPREALIFGQLKVGQKAKIVKVDDETSVLGYLDRLNIKIKDEFKVIGKDEFDESLIIIINNREVAISPKAFKYIVVSLIGDDENE